MVNHCADMPTFFRDIIMTKEVGMLYDNTSMSKTMLREMISRFSIFIVLVTDEDLAWQIHRTEYSQSFHQKGMGTVCSEGGGHRGWGTELPLLIILCHRFDFDGAKKVIHMLIFITKKIVGKVWMQEWASALPLTYLLT